MVTIIGISGGSGSCKTTLARKIARAIGEEHLTILSQDSYYIDQSAKFDKDGGAVNFDHPQSLDFNLMATHAKDLKAEKTVNVPVYDFATHKRLVKTVLLHPHPIVILEGTLLLSQKNVRDQCDIKIFMDVPEEARFERRLKRDVQERGRKPEGVRDQFYKQVKPMHDEFVEPSKKFADIVVTNDEHEAAVQNLLERLKK